MIDITKPFEISLEKFKFNSKKDDLNQFAIKKLVKNKYTEQGYSIIPGENFEENLLIEFVKKHKVLDKYTKVKLGEYIFRQKVADYNKQILEIFEFEKIEKLLFICRFCSYMGDPGFPDYIINKGSDALLRQTYTGDELISEKIMFIFLAKMFGIETKLSTLDFEDFQYPESLKIDLIKTLEEALHTLETRVNFQNSFQETGIDFSVFKKWVERKSIDTDEFLEMYKKFLEKIRDDTALKALLEKMHTVDLSSAQRQEKLKSIRQSLGVNMILASDLLNVYEILNQK